MSEQLFQYRINGLDVESDFALEEAEPTRFATADLHIRRARIPAIAGAAPDEFRKYESSAGGDVLDYAGTGRFRLREPGLIEFDPEETFDLRRVGLPLLGPVLALLLHRRGHFVLHGSSVLLGDEAHVFLGDKGAGKSTTAAALVAAGHPLLADDVVALERTADGLIVHACFAAMKLDHAMLARFPAGSYRVIEPDDGVYTAGKSRVRLNQINTRSEVRLGGIHVLARGENHAVTSLGARDALQALIRFSHYPRFGGDAVRPAETAALFAQAVDLAHLVRVDRLTVKNDLDAIAGIVSLITSEITHDHALG